MRTDQSHEGEPQPHLIGRALWWAYERAPSGLDAVFQLGRRYATPLLRHRLELRRLTGAASFSGRQLTVITAGAAMTLDFLVKRVFAEPPAVERLASVSLARLPGMLEGSDPSADLTLACVPRVLAGWFGERYLRVPALVSFRQPVGSTLEATLAPATYNVRRDARRVVESGYDWSFTRELGDFERFYRELYGPFIRERFGPLAVLRGSAELRRHFRHRGGVIWVRQAGRAVAGGLVREHGRELRALVEAVHPDWRHEVKPSPQFAVNIATFDVASRLGVASVDLGGTAPSLRDGVFRAKRAWGAAVRISGESHRDLLVRWPAGGAALPALLHAAPLLFEARGRLCALAATEPGRTADAAAGLELWRQLAPPGLSRLFLLGAAGAASDVVEDPSVPRRAVWLCPEMAAACVNGIAARDDQAWG